jgi:hypothetical protein
MNDKTAPIDKALVEMLKRKKFEFNQVDDGDIYIEDDESMFQLSVGELTCMHKNWVTETDEVHLPPPQSDYEVKYAHCPDCDEDVTDDVGFNEPEED